MPKPLRAIRCTRSSLARYNYCLSYMNICLLISSDLFAVPGLLEYESIPGVLSSKPFGRGAKSGKSVSRETEDIITVKDITNKVTFFSSCSSFLIQFMIN